MNSFSNKIDKKMEGEISSSTIEFVPTLDGYVRQRLRSALSDWGNEYSDESLEDHLEHWDEFMLGDNMSNFDCGVCGFVHFACELHFNNGGECLCRMDGHLESQINIITFAVGTGSITRNQVEECLLMNNGNMTLAVGDLLNQ